MGHPRLSISHFLAVYFVQNVSCNLGYASRRIPNRTRQLIPGVNRVIGANARRRAGERCGERGGAGEELQREGDRDEA